MIPAVDGLLPETHNSMIITLLYRLAEWHALAKLRMHTEHTLQCLEKSTSTIGEELRNFRDATLKSFKCQELPKETATRSRQRQRRNQKAQANNDIQANPEADAHQSTSDPKPKERAPPKSKRLNLFTYKLHALGDYVRTIRLFGTTDSYSTQIVRSIVFIISAILIIYQGELAHRLVKRFYTRTNKINAVKHIAKQERRHARLRRARDAAKLHLHRKHIHHVGFSDNDPLPCTGIDIHHHISDSTRYYHSLLSFVRDPPNDPAKKVHWDFKCNSSLTHATPRILFQG